MTMSESSVSKIDKSFPDVYPRIDGFAMACSNAWIAATFFFLFQMNLTLGPVKPNRGAAMPAEPFMRSLM